MNPVIYQFEHSPYCLPITQALTALGIPFSTVNVSNGNRQAIIELTAGRYYQVPVLVHGTNILFESSGDSLDVARYVDRTFAQGALFPPEKDGHQQILVRYLENDVEGVTFRLVDPDYLRGLSDPVERVMIIRHKERKFGAGCVERWTNENAELSRQAERLLAPLDDILRYHPFLFGPRPVYADFALYGILGNLTYRDYNTLPAALTHLSGWFERLKAFRFV